MLEHERSLHIRKKPFKLNHAFGGSYDLHHMMRTSCFLNKVQWHTPLNIMQLKWSHHVMISGKNLAALNKPLIQCNKLILLIIFARRQVLKTIKFIWTYYQISKWYKDWVMLCGFVWLHDKKENVHFQAKSLDFAHLLQAQKIFLFFAQSHRTLGKFT
jgi:hypothetical protein